MVDHGDESPPPPAGCKTSGVKTQITSQNYMCVFVSNVNPYMHAPE